MARIVVIGGGVAGLGAAFKLERAAEEGHDVTFTLLEKDDRLGGKIASERVADPGGGGEFVIDGGPDCFLTEKPACHRIGKLTGIFDDELPTDESRKRTFILARGRLHDLPDGVMMFAPTKFVPFATTGLFSWPGKIRMGMDLFIARKERWAEGDTAADHDETLESFVVRRMGRECLDRLAEPLVGGVHASDPDTMSLAATFPRLLEMEQTYGGMIRGFVAARRKVAEMRKKYPPKPGAKPRTFFTSYVAGMQQLTDSMADAAGRANLRTGAQVEALERAGEGWRVRIAGGETLEADAVIVATEGWAAADLLASFDKDAAAALAGIPHTSSATVSLGFDEAEAAIDTNAFGLLCPLVEGRQIMAATFSSTKWPGRAPAGRLLMRGFVGGPHNQAALERSDAELVEVVRAELRDVFGLKAEPLFSRVYRWERGMPQYTMGHLHRVSTLDERCAATAGLALAGGSYTGVGVPNCIESGEKAVSKVLRDHGIELAEDSAPPEKRYY
ncbi:MAG: protoporphyrinogen oxidase [Coriobacteriia bacterium]|nr:protoporphyrinogen oxidase [Coriobacteriia bacterium]